MGGDLSGKFTSCRIENFGGCRRDDLRDGRVRRKAEFPLRPAALAGLCWFVALGIGARLLSGFLARSSAWRVLDGLIATMIALGATLIAGA